MSSRSDASCPPQSQSVPIPFPLPIPAPTGANQVILGPSAAVSAFQAENFPKSHLGIMVVIGPMARVTIIVRIFAPVSVMYFVFLDSRPISRRARFRDLPRAPPPISAPKEGARN